MPRWHGSMSGKEKGVVAMPLATEIAKAGCEFTLTHSGQSSGWFDVWKPKLWQASGAVVIDSQYEASGGGADESGSERASLDPSCYRGRFTEPLKMEAGAILRRRIEDPTFKLFVWNPDKDAVTTVRTNILDNVPHMGDIDGWEKFVRSRGADPDADSSEPAPQSSPPSSSRLQKTLSAEQQNPHTRQNYRSSTGMTAATYRELNMADVAVEEYVPPAAQVNSPRYYNTPKSAQDVALWIKTVPGIKTEEAEAYGKAFVDADIDADTMDEVSKEDLEEIVANAIHRAKLVSKWKKYRQGQSNLTEEEQESLRRLQRHATSSASAV